MSGQIEKPQDMGTDSQALVTRWLRELELADKHEKRWRRRAKKVVEKYRDEAEEAKEGDDKPLSEYNILYANTEVLKGVMYQRTPSPDVRRRYKSSDPVGREAASVLKQALTYTIDTYDFDGLMSSIVEDVLLPGRGVARVRYIPTYATDGDIEQVVYEEARCEYVEWDMFRYSPAKRWSKVRWVAFGELMTREDLAKSFGKAGQQCTLNWMPKGMEDTSDNQIFKRALVWMIWEKATRKVFMICDGYKSAPLSVADDPLRLEGFFPMPEPVYGIRTTNTLVPIPEYTTYQNQAQELDEVSRRIAVLTGELKRRGVYDASYPELKKIADAGDNEFVPIEKFTQFTEKGGLDKAIVEAPIETLSKVIVALYEQRNQIKAVIYELTGISDIVRGSTDAGETLGAQELKAKYSNVRVGPRQKAIQRFARDILRLKAEIIAEHFSPETLGLMVGKPIAPEVLQLLKHDRLRGFRIDIETDSTIEPDATEEQQNRVELLGAITGFMEKAIPAVQMGAVPMEVAKALLMFGVRSFKAGPDVEEIFEQWEMQAPAQGVDPAMQMQMQQQEQQMQVAQEQLTQREQQLGEQEASLKDQAIKAEMDRMRFEYDKKEFDMQQKLQKFMTQKDEEVKKHMAETTGAKLGGEDVQNGKVDLIEQFMAGMQAMQQMLAQMIDAQQALLQGQQQIAQIASAERVSTLARGPNGEKMAVSRVLMQ